MCIIMFKPKGVELPPDTTFAACRHGNPNGMGYMFAKDGKVSIRKGFSKYNRMLDSVKLAVSDPKKTPMVFHFRYGTAGYNNMGNCHPFPVCGDYKEMGKTRNECDLAFAHNGVFDIEDKKNDTVSDSMVFVKHILFPNLELFEEESWITDNLLGNSKIILMRGNGKVTMFGEWQESEGVYYSNYGYMTFTAARLERYVRDESPYKVCQGCTYQSVSPKETPCLECLRSGSACNYVSKDGMFTFPE